ncbi:hypothetical protein SPRG_02636 [Saprolegnia parasitica CBS 223.65]|uniref:Uncharacterized protein n=1 Tax=Saprolegnia parasitica (strain CBS 223.65) TaxID=695850 RepID=A0A067CQZ4_SAPPC|nr:hypothetical protein SPRG_02636 [Saprolegnia parasitica CBS 223.65]KDO32943.1 hypothetical protein SPRG_02636 [Saprolegnia parasitica CBS 223.65]|eukprot:XP_012196590.1 hypothetical protein SPRG_02636 [Saprolegnia parasitica CBS 223.65]
MDDETLFLFELIVDSLSLEGLACSADQVLSIGFQLLAFDVVLLHDVQLKVNEHACLVQEGKSCMFRMPMDRFVDDVAATPLALMVMKKSDTTSRQLLAFTCIDLPMPSRHARLERAEWVHLQRQWDLLNHAGDVVGSIGGGVVLTCHGRALLAHLPPSFAATVDAMAPAPVAPTPESKPETIDVMCSTKAVATDAADAPMVETSELAVQCDLAHDMTISPVAFEPTSSPAKNAVAVPMERPPSPALPAPVDDNTAGLFESLAPPALLYHCPRRTTEASEDAMWHRGPADDGPPQLRFTKPSRDDVLFGWHD